MWPFWNRGRALEGSTQCLFCGQEAPPPGDERSGAFLTVVMSAMPEGAMAWACHVECVKQAKHASVDWPTDSAA